MGILVVLIFLQVNEKFRQLHQREITFYATGNHVAIEAIHGTSGIFIADSILISDEQKMQFHIYHHWWKRGFTHIVRHIDSDVSSTLVLENTKILRVENADDISTKVLTNFEPDILYYNARWFNSTTPIINKNAIHTIVVGPKTAKKAREQIVQYAANHSISVHQLPQDGALKITLDSEGKPIGRIYPKTSEKAKVESNRTPFSVFFTEHNSF
jgi:hypothetical protein